MAKLFASRAAEHVTSKVDRDLRRLRLHPRVPGGEVLPRPEGRPDLRGHHATCSSWSSPSRSWGSCDAAPAATLLGPRRALLDRFASTDPTPGGGSAAALAGAHRRRARGHGLRDAEDADGRSRGAGPAGRRPCGWAREASSRLRSLVDEDSARLRRGDGRLSPAQGHRRGEGRAQDGDQPGPWPGPPRCRSQTAEACLVVLRAAAEAAQHGNPNALRDARTGGALAWAGLLGRGGERPHQRRPGRRHGRPERRRGADGRRRRRRIC